MGGSTTYSALAALLAYPDADYSQRITKGLDCAPPDCRDQLTQFANAVQGRTTIELQELFTRTFDLNPVCSLELGWHLFGENYERGVLLVRMRQELRRHQLPESSELPDHLTHVLRLVGRMEHGYAADFVGACVLPALKKMRQAIHGKENPFEQLLEAVNSLLRSDFSELPMNTPETEPLLKVLV